MLTLNLSDERKYTVYRDLHATLGMSGKNDIIVFIVGCVMSYKCIILFIKFLSTSLATSRIYRWQGK